jgi:hypothetical protein
VKATIPACPSDHIATAPISKPPALLCGLENDVYRTLLQLATDLASRGLDILGCEHVINFDMPRVCPPFSHCRRDYHRNMRIARWAVVS